MRPNSYLTNYRNIFESNWPRHSVGLVSDVYDSRPWCVFELTQGSGDAAPIILVDIGGRRISRTFPYGAGIAPRAGRGQIPRMPGVGSNRYW